MVVIAGLRNACIRKGMYTQRHKTWGMTCSGGMGGVTGGTVKAEEAEIHGEEVEAADEVFKVSRP